ncbi:MAG: type II secretion system F family protein [Bacillota bacterium]
MGYFVYEAINKSGETVTGRLEADEEAKVVERLRGMGLMALEIKAVKQSSLAASLTFTPRVKLGDLSLFSRQLAAMLNSGIPLTRALFTLSRQVTNPTLGRSLNEVARNVEGGVSFSEALRAYPAIFSSLYMSMIRAGEVGGNLETTLTRLAHQLQKEKELRDSVRSSTYYPIAVVCFAVMVLLAMLFFLVPIFMSFFPEGVTLPLPTRVIIGVSQILRRFWLLVLPGLLLALLGLNYYRKSPQGKERLDRIKFRLPVFGPLIQKTVVARFARTFSTLLASGIPVVQALEASGATSDNTLVINAIRNAGEKIHEGRNIASPLEESGVFPPMVTHMITVGEETGDLPQMMDKVADFFEEEVSTMTKGLTALIEPLMLIGVGLLVGGMLIALYLPIFSVITQVG